MIGVAEENHPFGSTVATESIWDDSFVEEFLLSEDMGAEEFDLLDNSEQERRLRKFSRELANQYEI